MKQTRHDVEIVHVRERARERAERFYLVRFRRIFPCKSLSAGAGTV
jgi:hypothetical protein